MSDFILASASPRRAELLRSVGYDNFEIVSANIDETPHKKETPKNFAKRMAEEKCNAVRALRPGRVVLGADTVSATGSAIIDKATSDEDVRDALRRLSGKSHRVYSAVCRYDPRTDGVVTRICESRVTFKRLSEKEIEDYVASQEGIGKAGGCALQGRAARFVTKFSGSHSGAVGLPLYHTCNLLDGVLAILR